MLKVHFAPNSRAGRIIWLMEELELEYEVNVMPFQKKALSLMNIGLDTHLAEFQS